MRKYIQGKDGKFRGSVRSGKAPAPQPAPAAPTSARLAADERFAQDLARGATRGESQALGFLHTNGLPEELTRDADRLHSLYREAVGSGDFAKVTEAEQTFGRKLLDFWKSRPSGQYAKQVPTRTRLVEPCRCPADEPCTCSAAMLDDYFECPRGHARCHRH